MSIYEAVTLEPRIRGILKNQFPVAHTKRALREWLDEIHIHINDAYSALHDGALDAETVDITVQAIKNAEDNMYIVRKQLIAAVGDDNEQPVTYH